MKTPKIINAIELIDNELIENANKAEKKPFYIKPVFKRATAIAACLAIVAVSAFVLTNKTNNNISSNNNANSNNSSKTSSQNKKVIYVTGDSADNYSDDGESLMSLRQKYISPALQQKMDLYKDYKDATVVYRVLVSVINVGEYYEEGDRLVDANKEVQLLFEQKEAAYLEEQKAYAEYTAFGEDHPDWLANPEKYPELTAECSRLAAIYEAKEKIRKELSSKWGNLRSEIISKYLLEAKTERLKFATQYSEKEPMLVTDAYYKDWTFYMDLTAEEINILAEKGGYIFKLSSNDYIPGEENA